jgi:hypothetical protein
VHAQRKGMFIKGWEFEATRVQLLMVDHHPGILHVKDLHDILPSVNENEYPTFTYILVHKLSNDPAQRIETLAHICRQRIKVVLKGPVQMEHIFNLKDKQECGGDRDPDPGLSVVWFRWDKLPPIIGCL